MVKAGDHTEVPADRSRKRRPNAGRDSRFRGTQGTSIIGLFGAAAAWSGVSEKTLKRRGDGDYEKIYLFPNSHAGYRPGAKLLAPKFIFRESDARVLGAQAVGEDAPGVDKRISALAIAIQMGATIHDLDEAALCYAPQFGSAEDAVNFARMVAADVLDGDMPLAHWDGVKGVFLLGDDLHRQPQRQGLREKPRKEFRCRRCEDDDVRSRPRMEGSRTLIGGISRAASSGRVHRQMVVGRSGSGTIGVLD